jgi:hypothetical protein
MCHICLIRDGNDMIKCKLCCDGMEQDACIECAQVYGKYRSTNDKDISDKLFAMLKARRSDGIKQLKENKR